MEIYYLPFQNHCIINIVVLFIFQDEFSKFISKMIKKLTAESTHGMKIRILTCLNGVLSGKTFETVSYSHLIVQHLTTNWTWIFHGVVSSDVAVLEIDGNYVVLFEFIRLWRKIVKCLIKCEHMDKFANLERLSASSYKIWDLMIKLNNYLLTKTILKLFNGMLPYGNLLSQSVSNIHMVFRQTSNFVLKFFQQNGFSQISLGKDCGFTGVSIAINSSFDKVQLRLLVLLTLKTTAVVSQCPEGNVKIMQ